MIVYVYDVYYRSQIKPHSETQSQYKLRNRSAAHNNSYGTLALVGMVRDEWQKVLDQGPAVTISLLLKPSLPALSEDLVTPRWYGQPKRLPSPHIPYYYLFHVFPLQQSCVFYLSLTNA